MIKNDEHLYNKNSPYKSRSSESDDENLIITATPTLLKTSPCYSDDGHLTTDSDSTASYDDSIGSSYSSDDDEFLNSYFDPAISHRFINDSTEEESDDEFVYEVGLLHKFSLQGIPVDLYLIQNSQVVKKVCGPQKGYGQKRCEIQGGGQEMAVMVG